MANPILQGTNGVQTSTFVLLDSNRPVPNRVFSPTMTKIFWATLAPLDPFVGFLFTQPLSDALALNTHTHGTNFSNYLNIRCYGADPSKGGADNGSMSSLIYPELKQDCQGYFHLFKDPAEIERNKLYFKMNGNIVQFETGKTSISDIQEDEVKKGKGAILIQDGLSTLIPEYQYRWKTNDMICMLISSPGREPIEGTYIDTCSQLYLRFFNPLAHCGLSGSNMWSPEKENLFLKMVGAICGLVTPILSIRMDPANPLVKHFEVDPDYAELAYRTKYPISTRYIGLEGIIRQGFSGNVWERMKGSPIKVSIGLIRLFLLTAAIWAILKPKQDLP